ncbi:hypothetical protein ACFMB7_30515 (plasmid) [Bacillus toyonensis]
MQRYLLLKTLVNLSLEILVFGVKVGDYIEFTHIEGEAQKEKTRATLTNLENSKQEFVGKKKTYQVTPTGLLIK